MADPTTPDPDDTPTGATVTVTAKRPRLTYDDLKARALKRGYSDAGAEAIARNFTRESGGDPTKYGDDDTSAGLGQWHLDRLTDLKAYAAKAKKDWKDPDVQFDFMDDELKAKYPTLRKQLAETDDADKATDAFKRLYERPKSVMWTNRPGNDDYAFSDYALAEHAGKPNTKIAAMSPDDYLALSPEFEEGFHTSPASRSLNASLQRGEPIESIPTLDISAKGPTGTVTDQDGRHRALAAQEAGLDTIPVAMRGKGLDGVTELVGQQGTVIPHDHPTAPQQTRKSVMDWLVPPAEAAPVDMTPGPPADDNPYARFVRPAPQGEGSPATDNPYAQFVQAQAPADDATLSFGKGMASGFGQPVFGAQELAGQAMTGLGIPGGEALTADARTRLGTEAARMAPDEAAHPTATTAGEATGAAILPGLIASRLPGGPVALGALGGALSGAAEPTPGEGLNFFANKALNIGEGAVAGAVLPIIGKGVAAAIKPVFRQAVTKLLGEGVKLTPGQLAGGAFKRMEDVLASVPGLGVAIRAGIKRSFDTFNRAAGNRALNAIGEKVPEHVEPGRDMIGHIAGKFRDAYDAVIPNMTGAVDPQLQNDIVNITTLAQNLPPELRGQLDRVIKHDVLSEFTAQGRTSGKALQDIGTKLDNLSNTMKIDKDPDVRRLGRAVQELDASLDRMSARVNGPLYRQKEAIDGGYANYKILEQASTSLGAPNGVFTPAQLLNAVKARNVSKDKASFAKGFALMQDIADAAKDVLPAKVPDSGTPERLLMAGVLGEGAQFHPGLAAAAGATALPYTSPGMSLLRQFAIGAPATRALLSGAVRQGTAAAAPWAGAGGANALRGLAPQQGPQQ